MYRLAVCEDEADTRSRLCSLCREILERAGVPHALAAYSSAEELGRELANGARFDLLCLDIVMEGKSGMELARELRAYDDQTSILFITSSEAHLREGYSVRPIQYLFKPVDPAELEQAIRTDLRLYHQPRSLALQAGGRTVTFPLSQIWYIESRNHTVEVWTAEDSKSFWLSLSDVEKLLPPGRFCRCHKSFLVNMEYVVQIGRREVLLSNGRHLPVSRSCYETAQEQFVRFLNMR